MHAAGGQLAHQRLFARDPQGLVFVDDERRDLLAAKSGAVRVGRLPDGLEFRLGEGGGAGKRGDEEGHQEHAACKSHRSQHTPYSRSGRQTVTADPSARNAEQGAALSASTNRSPYIVATSQSRSASVTAQTRHDGWRTSVLDRAAIALRRVAPVVLSDELGLAARLQRARRTGGSNAYGIPPAPVTPRVCDAPGIGDRGDVRGLAPHAAGDVRLVVHDPGRQRDRAPRHDLSEERDRTTHLAIHQSSYVEPEIDLVEVTMKRNRQAEHAGVHEAEPYDADNRVAAPQIDLGAGGHVRTKHCRVDAEVEHRQVPPVGGEKRAMGHAARQ